MFFASCTYLHIFAQIFRSFGVGTDRLFIFIRFFKSCTDFAEIFTSSGVCILIDYSFSSVLMILVVPAVMRAYPSVYAHLLDRRLVSWEGARELAASRLLQKAVFHK